MRIKGMILQHELKTKYVKVRAFACHGALRLRSDKVHVLTPLSEENLRPERRTERSSLAGGAREGVRSPQSKDRFKRKS
mgnify:CR=1 FL=1